MNNTISDFRSFLSPDKKADDFNLKETVERTVSFVEYSLKASNIDLKLNLSDVTAYGFPNYYSQVLMNIINNARDVLEERRISEPFIQIKSYKSSKTKRSVLTVEDNAGGINSELLSQIFKPYFTTKSKDKGTGLGLYMSKVLIEKNMKGRLSVKNTSVGACFRIEI
jgi:signal transduction histidine kinase